MTPIKEPKNIDFSKKSEPWTEEELSEFRKVMQEIKLKNLNSKKSPSRINNLRTTTSKEKQT